jgi:hypothetical protein
MTNPKQLGQDRYYQRDGEIKSESKVNAADLDRRFAWLSYFACR